MRIGPKTLSTLFALDDVPPNVPVRYNVAPTDQMPSIIQERGKRQLRIMRWGLIPPWAKDVKIGVQMINARSESVAEKPAFRDAIQKRRCLVPADGFYEWDDIYPDNGAQGTLFDSAPKARAKPKKQPYHITLKEGQPFAFAGIFEVWRNITGETIESFSILTCPPNELLRPIHDRMPVLLHPEHFADWLDKTKTFDQLHALCTPYPAEEMMMRAINPKVGNVANDCPEVLLDA